MQGLRPFVQQQDENSVFLHRGVSTSKSVLGGDAGFTKQAPAGLPGQRRALGNITNRGGGSQDVENAPPSKTPAAAGPRRALGDITNARPLQQLLLRPAAAEKPGLAPQPVAAAVPRPLSRAEAWAEEGVERLAGRGWQELEADRLARADAEIDQRLLAFAALGKRSLPTFFPLWSKLPAAAPAQDGLQREALPSLPASPCMSRQPSGRSLDLGLEDMELPEISFALNDDDFLG